LAGQLNGSIATLGRPKFFNRTIDDASECR
jgi:hypothetical protein